MSTSKRLPVPKRQQIIDAILGDIAAGRLKPGDPLPSAAELRAQFDCSITPVREAVNWLKAVGYVTGVPGVRVFVADPQPGISRTV
jgi:DNA-binding GntR family transcriptional regulator